MVDLILLFDYLELLYVTLFKHILPDRTIMNRNLSLRKVNVSTMSDSNNIKPKFNLPSDVTENLLFSF